LSPISLLTVRIRYNLLTRSPPCRSRPSFRPAYGDFYFRASGGLVTRTAAGYHYSGNWASSTDGTYCFTPARTPTSIAATQATDRAYRIGQTKEVSVYLPILRDPTGRVSPTFDERLDLLTEGKQRLAEDFLRPLPPEDEMGEELFMDLRAEANRSK